MANKPKNQTGDLYSFKTLACPKKGGFCNSEWYSESIRRIICCDTIMRCLTLRITFGDTRLSPEFIEFRKTCPATMGRKEHFAQVLSWLTGLVIVSFDRGFYFFNDTILT